MTLKSQAKTEWRSNWTVVLAAMMGMSFSSLAPASLGLFIEPLTQEFGWERAQLSLGLAIYAMFAVPFSPFVGALIDKIGSRHIAIGGLILASLAFAAFSLANGSVTQWLLLWVIYASVALGVKSTVWAAAVSGLFSAGRGLALAVVFCGTAVTQTLSPLIARWLIDTQGWRDAYRWLGLAWGGLALVLVIVFLVDSRRAISKVAPSEHKPVQLSYFGLTLKQALLSRPLQKVAIATLLTSVLSGALIVHQVPILSERGMTREAAAWLAAIAGFSSLLGKLFTGYLFDRSRSGWIGGISLSLPAIGCVILLGTNVTPVLTTCAIAIIGYTGGAYLQLCTYLTTRYGGLLNFGKIFGVMASVLGFGTGAGPVVAGLIFDKTGSYSLLLMCGVPVALIAGALVSRLGPYPTFEGSPSMPAADEAIAERS